MLSRMTAAPLLRGIALALRPFRDWLRFEGRSTRSEVIAFLLFYAAVAQFMRAALPVSAHTHDLVDAGWELAGWLPVPALCVRRLHDQGRSARWGLAFLAYPLAVLAMGLLPQGNDATNMRLLLWSFHPAPSPAAALLILIATFGMMAMLVLMLHNEDVGPNRFGDDPRELDTAPPRSIP